MIAPAVSGHGSRPPQEPATAAHRRNLAQALHLAERWEEARALLAPLLALPGFRELLRPQG